MGKKSNKTTTTTVYGNTMTSNPYAYSKTDNSGTISGFQKGTAFQTIYDFVNQNAESLLHEYLKPNLNSVTNQAKLKTFANTLSQQTRNSLENNIINSLSDRNMIRSSQASDMYKNLANQNQIATSNFVNDLLSNSQSDTAKMLSNLLSYYVLGASFLTDLQKQSLNTSSGNATKTASNSGGSQSSSDLLSLALSAMMKSVS